MRAPYIELILWDVGKRHSGVWEEPGSALWQRMPEEGSLAGPAGVCQQGQGSSKKCLPTHDKLIAVISVV